MIHSNCKEIQHVFGVVFSKVHIRHLAIFIGARALRDAHMVTFFFRRFRDMCQFFKLVRQISQKPEQIRTPCFR